MSEHGRLPVVLDNGQMTARLREKALAERDRYIVAFNRLEAAITHHRKAKLHGVDTSDEGDEALWKVRDKILSDLAAPRQKRAAGDSPS